MKRFIFGALSALSRLFAALADGWKIVLIAAFFLSPVGPHLRWEYTYREAYGHRAYVSCTYVGARGFITPNDVEGCPVIAWLDAREWRR